MITLLWRAFNHKSIIFLAHHVHVIDWWNWKTPDMRIDSISSKVWEHSGLLPCCFEWHLWRLQAVRCYHWKLDRIGETSTLEMNLYNGLFIVHITASKWHNATVLYQEIVMSGRNLYDEFAREYWWLGMSISTANIWSKLRIFVVFRRVELWNKTTTLWMELPDANQALRNDQWAPIHSDSLQPKQLHAHQ